MKKILLLLIALSMAMPVLAVHTAKISLNPMLTAASADTQFTVNVTNLGKDRISELRVRMPVDFSGLKCGTAPSGWAVSFSDAIECNYKTVANYIMANSSLGFTVTAKTGDDDKNYTWELRTRDVFDGFSLFNPVTNIDKSGPAIKPSTLTAPNGGEKWVSRTGHDITWKGADITDANLKAKPVTLEYSTDGKKWDVIAKDLENGGSYAWTVPDANSTSVKVRLTAADSVGNAASDESDGAFTISPALPTTVLIVGDNAMIDIDKDGKTDFIVALVDITNKTAILTFTSLKPAATTTTVAANGTTTVPSRPDQTTTIVIVILIVIIVYLIWKLQQTGKKK
ncbi:MAG: hypothetical protein HYT72_04720 [Candidatus Aenigmarchaeota archaeon]|nr:hypothetical protein [Candidatus Aenigmarchaeota archaeon]